MLTVVLHPFTTTLRRLETGLSGEGDEPVFMVYTYCAGHLIHISTYSDQNKA